MMTTHTRTPGLSVVIPNWNGRALLEKFLPSVVTAAAAFEAASRQPSEVIVADDASTDDSLEWLAVHFPQVHIEAGERNQGFAATANRGVAAARFGLVYLVNNDVALAPASLPPLIGHFDDPHVFAVASQAYDYSSGVLRGAGQVGEIRRGFLGIHRRYFVPAPPSAEPAPAKDKRPFLTLYASGGSSLFDREKFLELGGFDKLFAPFGWEDVELGLRAWRRGYEVRFEPHSAVWHEFSSTLGGLPRRRVRAIYERNRLLAHWLHLDTRADFAAHGFFLLLKLLASILIGRWEVWLATVWALSRWRIVKARREQLRRGRQRGLREVLVRVHEELGRLEVRPLTAATAPARPYPQPGKPGPA